LSIILLILNYDVIDGCVKLMHKNTNPRKSPIMPFFIILLFVLIILNPVVYAWDNCPFGEVNESYPGTCGRYTDTDNDNICDLSQSPPESRVKMQEEKNSSTKSNSGMLKWVFQWQ